MLILIYIIIIISHTVSDLNTVVRLSSNELLTNISLLADSCAAYITSRYPDCTPSKGPQINATNRCKLGQRNLWQKLEMHDVVPIWVFLMNLDDLRNGLNTRDIWEHKSWTARSRFSWCFLDILACCQHLPLHTRWAETISYLEHFDLEHTGASVLPGAGCGWLPAGDRFVIVRYCGNKSEQLQ